MSRGAEKVSTRAKTLQAILQTDSAARDVIDKFAAALHQVGLTKEADLVFAAASTLWREPSDVDQIAAWFEAQAIKERELLDGGHCNNSVTTQERWLVYKASAQRVRAWADRYMVTSVQGRIWTRPMVRTAALALGRRLGLPAEPRLVDAVLDDFMRRHGGEVPARVCAAVHEQARLLGYRRMEAKNV